jgi:hypothetical protein
MGGFLSVVLYGGRYSVCFNGRVRVFRRTSEQWDRRARVMEGDMIG